MLVLGGYSSLFFDGKEITAFLKTLNRCFKDYEINDDTKKKKQAAKYSARQYRKDIERLSEYQNPSVSWLAFQKVLLREYRYSNLD
jgi:LPS sulfotransferase NodH